MPKAYEPGKVERNWYKFWLDKGYFTPKIDPARRPFTIIMPPPNVTGGLHLGHALTHTIEDIFIRWHRMKGEPTLWLPGEDHAGIAAQVVVERELAKEGTTRQKLGREKFTERMWQWAQKCRQTIREQNMRLGVSCDWTRERFTLDEGPSKAVRTAFVRLYDKGLIYRGERIINWCPRCATALSDLETDHKDIGGHLWHVRYPLADNPNEFITVATTRPETILGDTAVAVNPKDERFKKLVGRKAVLPVLKRNIPIIADEAVDPAFGTGAVKITPAHDPVDFEVAQRHSLPSINILNPNATMNEEAGSYVGMDRFACRKAILADLEKDGLLVKTEPYAHSVGHCSRCQTMVEPLASKQWFVKTETIAKPAIKAVNDGRIQIIPEHFTKIYLNWMENIRDWCISRQLWWGHRIPVWYCQDCNELTVSVDVPKACAKCGSKKIEQDPDVLDTWFSSALWPHSTLGWPDNTADLRYFYPTTVMETGYDILFFWVARMIMMGIEDTGESPFRFVFLNGLIRDEKGEKMSKVRGNVLDPLVLMDRYGTDALRFALTTGTSPGNDIKLSPAKVEAGRNFANKLWNAGRFVVRSLDQSPADIKIKSNSLPLEDRWILSQLSRTVSDITALLDEFQLGEAERTIHDFLWGEYCDWYIELAKIRLRLSAAPSELWKAGNPEAPSPLPVLIHVLETSLRLLHPFMPFVTEELWQQLKKRLPANWQSTESIMTAAYPEADAGAIDPGAEEVIGSLVEIVRSIRNARAQYKVAEDKWVEAQVHSDNLISSIKPYLDTVQTLAHAKPVTFVGKRLGEKTIEKALVMVLADADVVIPMASMFDIEAEKKRTQKEIEGCEGEIARLKARLSDNNFPTRAPVEVVDKERDKLTTLTDKLERLKQQLNKL
jgi:valyl-tRNA synthetase